MYAPIGGSEAGEGGAIMPASKAPAPLWKSLLLVFLPTLVAFVVLDMTWITLFARYLYIQVVADSLRDPPDVLPGLLAWLCVVGALYAFVLPLSRTPLGALRQGALMGLFIYGCYEFTNLCVLRNWNWPLALIDTAWGVVACGGTAVLQLLLARRVTR